MHKIIIKRLKTNLIDSGMIIKILRFIDVGVSRNVFIYLNFIIRELKQTERNETPLKKIN